jgi:prevent-host-death family protein
MAHAIYNVSQAQTSLAELVDGAVAGEEIVIARAGKPLAKLVPWPTPALPRKPGGWEGQIWISPDFDGPLLGDLLDVLEAGGDGREGSGGR